MRILSLAIFTGSLAAMSSPVLAQDRVIEIDNGLYAYSTGLSINGQDALEKDYEYCLTDKHTKRTLSELVNELADGGVCDVTNVVVTANRGSADMSCYDEDFGTTTGSVEADFSRTHYTVKAVGRLAAGIELRSRVEARRISDCPPGWTPPPGISDE